MNLSSTLILAVERFPTTGLLWKLSGYSMIILLLYFLVGVLHNIFSHPLSGFRGPILWTSSRLPRLLFAIRGTLDRKMVELHAKYGDVVRFSPDELSFNSGKAWPDIYARKDYELIKDPMWYNCVEKPGQSVSILNANHDDHARMRKYMTLAFSEQAMRQQETIVQQFIDKMVERLQNIAHAGEETDMVKWYNFIMFDLAAYLSIGKSFDCLDTGSYHIWVSSVFKYIKIRVYVAAIVVLTGSQRLVRWVTPKPVIEARTTHEQYVVTHGKERWDIGHDKTRKDIISYIFESLEKVGSTGNEKNEVLGNCNFLMRAGSETVATALSGLTYHLLSSPEALKTVVNEVRTAFPSEEAINFQTAASELPYLQACIREALRIYPPGPGIFPRRTPPSKNTIIAGHMVPGDVSVGVHNLSANLSPKNFADPLGFHLERWLTEGSSQVTEGILDFSGDMRDASQVFSMGSRNCIGKGLAFNEMRLVAARLLWNFDLVLCEQSRSWSDQLAFVIWQKPPLMCRLKQVCR